MATNYNRQEKGPRKIYFIEDEPKEKPVEAEAEVAETSLADKLKQLEAVIAETNDLKIIQLANELIEEIREKDKAKDVKIEELKEMATIDELTGLNNKRSFNEYLLNVVKGRRKVARKGEERETDKEQASNEKTAFLMIDIDHFKLVNDTHGHIIGDEVLARVGELMKNSVRLEDFTARWGGEELFIILNEITPEQAMEKANSIKNEIKKLKFKGKDDEIFNISISVGISFLEPEMTVKDFKANSDQALYVAKETGRDKVVDYNHLEEVKREYAERLLTQE